MNNNLMIFENPEFGAVRSILIDGDPWFVAADVCKALELEKTNRALSRLDDDEKGAHSVSTPGGRQRMSIISESGLYSLILGSRKPEVKAFKRWITHEVIPSIRKHGAYMTDALLSRMDEHPELISEYIGKLRAENAKANAAREALKKAEAENARLAPKASYYDSFVGVESVTCLRYTAKELGVPQKKFIGYLLEKGVCVQRPSPQRPCICQSRKAQRPAVCDQGFLPSQRHKKRIHPRHACRKGAFSENRGENPRLGAP